jgi:hypothetical protein
MMPNSAFHRTARRRRFACPLAAGERRRWPGMRVNERME